MANTDPDIAELLKQPMTDEESHAAFGYLQMYRMEALHAAESGKDRADKERLVEEARERLREWLRKLLGVE